MSWKFTDGTPIYKQINERIKLHILSGAMKPGDKLPPVRDLAVEAGVNPNTMQRALASLENEGLLYTERTSGRYITQDQDLINVLRYQTSRNITHDFYRQMSAIGMNREDIIAAVTHYGGNEL